MITIKEFIEIIGKYSSQLEITKLWASGSVKEYWENEASGSIMQYYIWKLGGGDKENTRIYKIWRALCNARERENRAHNESWASVIRQEIPYELIEKWTKEYLKGQKT